METRRFSEPQLSGEDLQKGLIEVQGVSQRFGEIRREFRGKAICRCLRRRFAILTCMDARLDPARYAEGDAHVVRNAGGRASGDAIRSLVISYHLVGTANGL